MKTEGTQPGGDEKQMQYVAVEPGKEPPMAKTDGAGAPKYVWAKVLLTEHIPKRPLNRSTLKQPIIVNLFRRPLWHPCVVEECLDILRPQLNQLVETGFFPWAWDLGTGRQRKELRILGHCIVEQTMGPIPGIGMTKNLGLEEVVNLILPKTRESYRSADLQRMFHLGPHLIQNLSATGEIRELPRELTSSGVNASPSYSRHSVVKLLEKRRVL